MVNRDRKIFIIKPDDAKDIITMNIETNFDFEFDTHDR